MKILYFDPILGVSGDMLLAALIDLGVSAKYIKEHLRFVTGADMIVRRVNRQGVSARTIRFSIKKPIGEKQFIPLINKSKLPSSVKSQAIKIIERIFRVEKKVHRTKQLHLHELADADTLLDVIGVVSAIDYLNVDRVFSKPVKAGSGFIKTAEGNMPAFNFATAELLRGFPVHFLPICAELTTPTGAAILSAVATPREDLVMSRIEKSGLGAGSMNIKGHPNLLRVLLGESHDFLSDECTILETNIDDMNPQDYEALFEHLYAAGALEVFLTPTIMKKSRPGVLLTVLCRESLERIVDVLFDHTTSIGFRIGNTRRLKFYRKIVKLPSPYGKVAVKIIEHDGKKRFSLEYRDLKKIAQKKGLAINEVRQRITQFFDQKLVKNHR